MRTTLNLDDDLITKARSYSKIKEKTALIHLALEILISKYAAIKLANMGGADRGAKLSKKRKLANGSRR